MPDATLTFDNGPDPEVTPVVLAQLRARKILSTFFVIGRNLEEPGQRPLAEQAHGEGHWIGNHTYTHSVPLGRMPGPHVADDEVARTERLIGSLACPDPLFRPYGGGGELGSGLLKRSVLDHLVIRRYTCVLWNVVPRDWRDPDGWADRALAACGGQDWSLVVLHDINAAAMRHLGRFLDEAAASGFSFRQDFSPDLVPLRLGEVVRPMDAYLSDPA